MSLRPLCVLAGLLLAGCLSQSPPAPAVRWFDATPAGDAPSIDGDLVVTAVPFVRSEFVVRVGERELAIDELHRWSAPPELLIARALGGSRARGTGRRVDVLVQRFELVTAGQPRAVVALQVDCGTGPKPVTVEQPAADASPAAFAAAMALAVGQAVAGVAELAAAAARTGG